MPRLHPNGDERAVWIYLCTARSGKARYYGRRLQSAETVCRHGSHSRQWQQGHRTCPRSHLPTPRYHGMAPPSPACRRSGLHIPPTPTRCVCGRLFLARLPHAWTHTRQQPAVLEREVAAEPRARPGGDARTAAQRLVCAPNLGARHEASGGGRQTSPSSAATRRAR